MKTINAAKFKATCLSVLDDQRTGRPVRITKRGHELSARDAVLFQKGDIRIAMDPAVWIRSALAKGLVQELPLSHGLQEHPHAGQPVMPRR